MEKPTLDPDEWIISVANVKRLYISMRRRLFKWALGGAFSFYLLFGTRDRLYKAEGSFKAEIEKQASETFFKELIVGITTSPHIPMTPILKSSCVLKPLIEKLGLQIKGQADFAFTDVYFEGEKKGRFYLQFINEKEFTVYNEEKKGLVNCPYQLKGMEFTLIKAPSKIKLGRWYRFEIVHWKKLMKKLKKRIKIKTDKENKSILFISALHKNRYTAAQIVNGLMCEYQAYLKKEYDGVARAQLKLLEERQESLLAKMEYLFDQHATYLSANLKKGGFSGLDQETESVAPLYRAMRGRSLAIDVELNRLGEFEKGDWQLFAAKEDLVTDGIKHLVGQLQSLTQERDLIEPQLAMGMDLRLEAQNRDVAPLLEEIEGIDLQTARALCLEYNGKLDGQEVYIRTLAQVKGQLLNSSFDLAPLSSLLPDPLSQKIIQEASALEVQLKDEKNHSIKEGHRWEKEVAHLRKVFIDHVDQLMLVAQLNADRFRQKMGQLQRITLDGIHQQMAVLREEMQEWIQGRKRALLIEKGLTEKKMEEIRAEMGDIFPEKWRFEKGLEVKIDAVKKMMAVVTEVVESKRIANQLHYVESKPLDFALVPEKKGLPYVWLLLFLGAFTCPFSLFSFTFIRQLIRGFPVSSEVLSALQIPHLGELSSFAELELLRKVALFSEGAKTVALILGKGVDYSDALGENLARRFAKSIFIRCDFSLFPKEGEVPGILQMGLDEAIIRQGKGFDFIAPGGYTPFGVEIIQSLWFKEMIERLGKTYDWVFLVSKGSLSSVETEALLRHSEKALVTLSAEQIEELTPFIHWGYDKGICRITFITQV